jgi:hypothetical protein
MPMSERLGVSAVPEDEDADGVGDEEPSAGATLSGADCVWLVIAAVCVSGEVAICPQPTPETARPTSITSRMKLSLRTIVSSLLGY